MTTISGNLHGLILAGGRSQRMGQDKSLLVYHGQNQLRRSYELLNPFCSQIFVSIRPDQEKQEDYRHLPCLIDLPQYDNKGPLGGIASAMITHPKVPWLILACDLPYITAETIQFLLQNRDPLKYATAFKSVYDGLPEPLCAIWEPSAMTGIEAMMAQGIHCPRKVLIKSDINLIAPVDPLWLENINSPEEYSKVKQNIQAKRM